MKWTTRLIEAANNAYDAINSLLGTKKGRREYSRGAGGDITVEIDKLAEEAIISTLKSFNEPLNIITEEKGLINWNPPNHDPSNFGNNYFIIDPVDGSTNAMRGLPFSCISIAYADGPSFADIQIGVVRDLNSEDLFIAEKNQGAFLNEQKIHCSTTTLLKEVIVGIDLNPSPACVNLVQSESSILRKLYKLRMLGSCALVLCNIAKGALDLYLDLRGIVRIVDIAAALFILQEAGGFMFNESGDPLEIKRFSLDDHYSIIAGCPGIKDKIKKEFQIRPLCTK